MPSMHEGHITQTEVNKAPRVSTLLLTKNETYVDTLTASRVSLYHE